MLQHLPRLLHTSVSVLVVLTVVSGMSGWSNALAADEASLVVKDTAEGPALNATEPETVVGQREPLRLILRGSGFRPGTKVAVGRDGKVRVLQQDLVEFIDSSRLAITVMPGLKRSKWAIQVSSPDNHRSNVLYLEVKPSPVATRRVMSAPAVSEPVAINSAVAVPQAVVEKSAAGPGVTSAPATASGIPDTTNGNGWLAAQPKSNYTLQLLVSRSRFNIEGFIQRHRLPKPLARFVMERDGQNLHVLTYGSFPNRTAAQQAMQDLPAGVSAWPRAMDDVQRVMRPSEASSVTNSVPMEATSDNKGTAWIWSQDPARFTIQLAASGDEEAVLRVKQGLSLPAEELGVALGQRNGKAWYVLVYGSFQDRESASDTIARLPPALKRTRPWPRTFSSLQDELSRATPQP